MARRKKIAVNNILEPVLKIIRDNLYLIIICIILALIGYGVYNIVLNSDYFIVKEIETRRIEGNFSIIDSSIKLKLQKGVNIFKFNLAEYQEQVEKTYPELKNVKVNRVLPDKIAVFFQKRKPACQIKSGLYYLVSDDAVVLPNPKIYPQAGLFIIKGIYINERRLASNRRLSSGSIYRALKLIGEIEGTDFYKRYKIAEIDVYDDSNPVICLENGIEIILGRHSFLDKQPLLIEVLNELESKNLKPKSIDLRFEDAVVTPK